MKTLTPPETLQLCMDIVSVHKNQAYLTDY